MEDLAIFTALHHLGSFGMNFVSFKKNPGGYINRKRQNTADFAHLPKSPTLIIFVCHMVMLNISESATVVKI